jgi:hypothetical protein
LESVEILFQKLGSSCEEVDNILKKQKAFAINLTHLPHLTGDARRNTYTGDHRSVKKQGVNEGDFVEMLAELEGLYLGQVFNDILRIHGKPFQGRTQLSWRGPGSFYQFHTDPHTAYRYHVPIVTNDKCYWVFKNKEQLIKLLMPADGRAWYLDPTKIKHTFINDSNTARLHLLMTSEI